MKKSKMARPHLVNMCHMEKFKLQTPPKFSSMVFQVLTETEY